MAVHFRPAAIEPISLIGLIVFTCFELSVEIGLKAGFHIFNFALRYQPVAHQTLCIKSQGGFLSFDFFVHHRIGEHRLIAFVMTKATIANDIKHHIFFEFLSILSGDARGMDYSLWVITIDVKNRGLDHQSNICGVGG